MKELSVEEKIQQKVREYDNDDSETAFDDMITGIISICLQALEMQREELFEKIEKLLDVCTEDDAIKNGCRRCQDYYEIKKTFPQPTFKEG